jgi:hypothetical protein
VAGRRDTFNLRRQQRVDVYCAGGNLRLIADHPLNALLIGVGGKVRLVRSAELAVEAGDKALVVYAAKAGKDVRAASATVTRRSGGEMRLSGWQVEQGFTHRAETVEGTTRHSIVAVEVPCLTRPAGAPATAPGCVSAFRKELR